MDLAILEQYLPRNVLRSATLYTSTPTVDAIRDSIKYHEGRVRFQIGREAHPAPLCPACITLRAFEGKQRCSAAPDDMCGCDDTFCCCCDGNSDTDSMANEILSVEII